METKIWHVLKSKIAALFTLAFSIVIAANEVLFNRVEPKLKYNS